MNLRGESFADKVANVGMIQLCADLIVNQSFTCILIILMYTKRCPVYVMFFLGISPHLQTQTQKNWVSPPSTVHIFFTVLLSVLNLYTAAICPIRHKHISLK